MKHALALSLLLSARAFGWGDLGHAAIGEIAERNLSPAGKALVCDVLGAEPLAVAATYPDHVRNDPRYKDFAPYHFIEVLPGASVAETVKANLGKKNAHTINGGAPDAVGRSNIPRDQRILLMRYLVHLVGDVHQPLHVGNGMDMGANLCDVDFKDPETGRNVRYNLHTVWDDHIFDWERKDFETANKGKPGKYFGYQIVVDNVEKDASEGMKAVRADIANLAKAAVQTWYEESVALHPKAYKDGVTDPRQRAFCKVKDPETGKYQDAAYNKKKIPTLGEPYCREALAVAHQQIYKAGHRLAYLLNDIAVRFPPSSGEGCAKAIVDAVQSYRAVDSVPAKEESK